MAKNLKQIITLIALCSLIIFSGCTQEKEFVNEHNHTKIKFEEVSFKQALSLPIFNNALQKVAKQRVAFRNDDAARTALEDQYGFTIVTDAPIRIVTDENGTVFYTILIEREVKEELVFENLMIKVEDNETTAAIFKYLMEGKGTISETGEYFFPNVETSEFTDLNVEGRVFYNSDTGEACVTTTQVMCNATWEGEPYNHIANLGCYQYAAGHSFSNLYESSSTVCFGSGGGGGGGTPDGSSNNTGGLGSSGGSTDPIDVTPIPCRTGNCIEADLLNKPCAQLKKLADPTKLNIKPQIDILKQKVIANVQQEWGVNFKKLGPNSTSTDESQYTYNTVMVQGGPTDVPMEIGESCIGSAHLHTIKGYNIFSWKDVYNLYLAYSSTTISRRSDVAMILVVANPNNPSSPNVYAIKVDDIVTFYSKINADLNNALYKDPVDVNKTFNNLNKSMLPFFNNYSSSEYSFIQRFTGYGISLYKATDENLDEWNKLKKGVIGNPLNPGGVESVPCIFQ